MKTNNLKLTDKQLKSLYHFVEEFNLNKNPQIDRVHSKLFKLFWDREEECANNISAH